MNGKRGRRSPATDVSKSTWHRDSPSRRQPHRSSGREESRTGAVVADGYRDSCPAFGAVAHVSSHLIVAIDAAVSATTLEPDSQKRSWGGAFGCTVTCGVRFAASIKSRSRRFVRVAHRLASHPSPRADTRVFFRQTCKGLPNANVPESVRGNATRRGLEATIDFLNHDRVGVLVRVDLEELCPPFTWVSHRKHDSVCIR